jgi:hypothetical protein
VQREKEIVGLAEKARENYIQQQMNNQSLNDVRQESEAKPHEKKLKHHFDNYIRALAFDK